MIKRTIISLALLSFFYAQVAMSAPIHPPVAISYLGFSRDSSGNYIAASNSNPSIMYEFEHPVLCNPWDDPSYNNGAVPICVKPLVFMDKGGLVKMWVDPVGEGGLLEYAVTGGSITDQAVGHSPDYYVTETPNSVYYCMYRNHESSVCRLFPDDPDVKIGDAFASCVLKPVSWARDKNGIFYDCDKKLDSQMRIAKFVVTGITAEGTIAVRCVSRYNLKLPLNKNGRLDMMGSMDGQSDMFLLVKLRDNSKAKKSKKK
jgi:hypothetical protein